jgi:mycofactocin precursor
MPQPITDVSLTSAEIEVDAEFVDAAGLEAMLEADLLVEDVSIDGMCGVY